MRYLTWFVEQWVKPTVSRYAGNGKIVGYQVWNEPNNADFPENNVIDVLTTPLNFLELISLAYDAIKGIDGGKLVLNGSTTSIAQKFPTTFSYNKDLVDAGITSVVDRFAIHYYGNNHRQAFAPRVAAAKFQELALQLAAVRVDTDI